MAPWTYGSKSSVVLNPLLQDRFSEEKLQEIQLLIVLIVGIDIQASLLTIASCEPLFFSCHKQLSR